jgi:hypothetical protein
MLLNMIEKVDRSLKLFCRRVCKLVALDHSDGRPTDRSESRPSSGHAGCGSNLGKPGCAQDWKGSGLTIISRLPASAEPHAETNYLELESCRLRFYRGIARTVSMFSVSTRRYLAKNLSAAVRSASRTLRKTHARSLGSVAAISSVSNAVKTERRSSGI